MSYILKITTKKNAFFVKQILNLGCFLPGPVLFRERFEQLFWGVLDQIVERHVPVSVNAPQIRVVRPQKMRIPDSTELIRAL